MTEEKTWDDIKYQWKELMKVITYKRYNDNEIEKLKAMCKKPK